jgi:hypothetical protein
MILPPAALEARRTRREFILFLCRETTAKEKYLPIADEFVDGLIWQPVGLRLLSDRRLPVR